MMDTTTLTQAVRSNDGRMIMGAFSEMYEDARGYNYAVVRVGHLSSPTKSSSDTPAVDISKGYFRHLRIKALIAFTVLIVSEIAAIVGIFDLFNGGVWFHPLIGVNIAFASIGLCIVAVVAIFEIGKYWEQAVSGPND